MKIMNKTKTASTVKNGGRKFKNDVIFILSLVVLTVAIGLFVYLSGEEGDTVSVYIDGEFYESYPLSVNISVDIVTGEDKSGLNTLVIKDGKAYVEYASCPDGICAAHKPISREGESIVCLPNRVVVSVKTETNEDGVDIIQ